MISAIRVTYTKTARSMAEKPATNQPTARYEGSSLRPEGDTDPRLYAL